MSIRVGILGYGNLGRGVECAVKQNDDMELAAVFTRRDPSGVTILTEGVPVCSVDDAVHFFVLRSAPINYFCFHNEFCLTYVPFSLCGNSHVEKPDAPSVSLHAYGQSFCGIPHTRF